MIATPTIELLRQRMIEDMTPRTLGPASHKSRLRAYKRFVDWLQRSPDTATADDIRLFQLHLAETGVGTVTRNATMTGLRFLFRVTLRRHDLAAEICHIKEPQKVPLILNQDETKRLLAMADTLRNRLLLSLGYGAGLRAGEVVRLKVKHIDSAQMIIHVEQSKGKKDRRSFKRFLGPLHRVKWVVYCKPPFAGPEHVLRYLSRYTHRVAISNRRLVAADDGGISFRWKNYRIEGRGRWKTMTLHPHEFIRRFLLHVLPKGFHRIRQKKLVND